MRNLILILACCLPFLAIAQYEPEIDALGKDDVTDGGELQLATPSLGHYLRFFSGRGGDPNPFIYFSNTDTLNVATGTNNFGGFTNLLRVYPNGEFATPWATTFFHNNPAWVYRKLPYLNKGWSGKHWDFMYLGATGNRNNNVQGAMMLTHQQGIQFGKGHNDGDTLSRLDMVIDSGGVVKIRDLEGVGEASVVVDADGTLKRGGFKYMSIPATAFHPKKVDSAQIWKTSTEGTFFIVPTANSLVAPITLPHGSTVTSVTIDYIDNDGSNNCNLLILGYDGSTIFSYLAALTSGSSVNKQSITVSSVFPIDNQTYSFSFEMVPVSGGPVMDIDFQIIRVLIQYVE